MLTSSGFTLFIWVYSIDSSRMINKIHVVLNFNRFLSETTLNYQMLMARYPNLKEEFDGSIPGCEISSLLDIKLVRWSTASCALTMACRHYVSKQTNKQSYSYWLFRELNRFICNQAPVLPGRRAGSLSGGTLGWLTISGRNYQSLGHT